MRILVIDDEPSRATSLVRAGHQVFIAHTMDQILFWLKYAKPIMVCLDHDLGRDYSGADLCRDPKIGLELISFGVSIRIWSQNPVGAERMRDYLTDHAWELDIDAQISLVPFGTQKGDILT